MTYDPYSDGCDNCGSDHHICDACPEFHGEQDYLDHVRRDHGPDDPALGRR